MEREREGELSGCLRDEERYETWRYVSLSRGENLMLIFVKRRRRTQELNIHKPPGRSGNNHHLGQHYYSLLRKSFDPLLP